MGGAEIDQEQDVKQLAMFITKILHIKTKYEICI
jgi:hypothetical protein